MPGHASADPMLDKENMDLLEEPAAKRRNMQAGATSRRQHLLQFGKGSVTRVRVHQFMTYSSATFEPGPRLNLVLGPNGTGKSSLVCALCLGLAGGTRLLGRGDNPKEFIQRGKKDAWVEVSLSRGDGTEVVVRRDLKLVHDSSEGKWKARSDWRINGAQKLMKHVVDLMKQLNVQLDNLCQFLPQDKVVEFARLTPCELLSETEKAIGDATLHTLHQDLIQRRSDLKEVTQGTDQKKRQLEKLQQEQARQQHEYERLQRRATLLEEVELMKKKITLLELAGAKAELREAKELHQQAEALLKTQRANMERKRGPLKQLDADAKKVDRTVKALQEALRTLERDAKIWDTQATAYDNQITLKTSEISDLQRQSDDRKARVADARRQLTQAQQEAAEVPQSTPPEHVAEFRGLSQQLSALNNQATELQMKVHMQEQEVQRHETQRHELHGQLQHISNVTHHRLRVLEHKYRGITDAFRWLQQNRSQFRGRVCGPVAVEVQVADPLHRRYLNMAVPSWIWGTFVTMYKEDEELLGRVFKQHNWKMPRAAYELQDYNTPLAHPNGEPSTMAHLGITATLDQVMEAPLLVKRYIDDQCGFSRAYVGSQYTEQVLEQVEQAGLRTVFTPQLRYSWKQSLYNTRMLSGKSDALWGPVEALEGQVDAQQVAQLRQQIQAAEQATAAAQQECEQMRQQLVALQAQTKPLQERKQELTAQDAMRVRQLKQLSANIRRHQTTLDRLQAEPEPLDRKARLEAEAADLARLIFEKYQQTARNLGTQLAKARELAVAELELAEIKALLQQKRDGATDLQRELQRTEEGHKQCAAELSAKKAEFERLKQKAESQGLDDPEVHARASAVEGDMEAVQERMQAKRAEADAIAVGDTGVLARYQERAARIAALEAEVGDEEGELARRQAEIEEIKGRWLPDLQRMVEKIHTTFSRNFEEMGCAGEVALVPHEDFDKWAIQIRVKFRASEELQVLTAHRQSGGERSVSTILYLIALQDVTVTPFRVVDEINQGMDPINERKVYTQLVEASTRPDTPQCFLLTPKLLPDLPYTDNITIMEIFNGREIDRSLDISDMDAVMFGTRHHCIAV